MAVRETRYQSQIGAGGAARLIGTSPEAMGAGVGRAVEQLGGTLQRLNLQHQELQAQRQYESDYAAGTKAATDFQLEAREKALEMEQNPQPGGAGHTAAYRDWYGKRAQEVLGTVANPRVRQRIDTSLASDAGSMILRADTFEAGARVAKWTQDVEDVGNSFATMAQLPDTTREVVASNIAAMDDMIMNGPGSEKDKRTAMRAYRDQQARSFIDSRDPDTAIAELKSGYWAGTLDPDKAPGLMDRAVAEKTRIENRAKAEAATALTAERERWKTARGAVERGEDVDPATFDPMIVRAEAAGDTSAADELKVSKAHALVLRTFPDGTLPAQVTAEIGRLEQEYPNWRQNPDIAKLRGALVQRHTDLTNAKPDGIPPPNMNDPKSVAAWEASVRAWPLTRGGGLPHYIYGDHEALLRDLVKQGDQGKRQALTYIEKMSPAGGFYAARELLPDDHVFQMAATYDDPRTRDLAMAGRGIMADPKSKISGTPLPELMDSQLKQLDMALGGQEGDRRTAARETAVAIAAALMHAQRTDKLTDTIADEAVRLTVGGTSGRRDKGGLHIVHNDLIVLPPEMNAEDFDNRYWRQAQGPSPGMADGERLTWDELRAYRLVTVDEGKYQFQDAYGHPVLKDTGEELTLDIRHIKPSPVPVLSEETQRAVARSRGNKY